MATKKITFAAVTDLQYAPLPAVKNRYFANAISKLEKALTMINSLKPDFLINLGDVIDRDFENIHEILTVFKKVKSPVYHVLGNHDFEVAEEVKSNVTGVLGIANYYQFSMGKWRFVVLDGNEISTFANLPKSRNFQAAEKLLRQMEDELLINARCWNGGLGKKQIRWLEAILKSAGKTGENVVLFCHYPLYPPDKHNLLNADTVLKVIGKYPCVKACFSGHNHQGNYGMYSDIHFINLKGMVEGEFDNPWSVVSLAPDAITINGHGTEISARLSLVNSI